jgi:hypothetical protein
MVYISAPSALKVLCMGLLAFSVGCEHKPSTGTVTGNVTYHQQPVTEGNISFRNEAKGLVAGIKLGPEGDYELRFAGGKEIPVGEYVVTIAPPVPQLPIASELGPAPPQPIEVRQFRNIPDKYRSSQTSDLTATVQEGPNRFDFDLHD